MKEAYRTPSPWAPILGSFAVYLVPVVGPHAAWLVGEMLFGEFTTPHRRRAAWLAADVGVAVAAQVVVAVLLAWPGR